MLFRKSLQLLLPPLLSLATLTQPAPVTDSAPTFRVPAAELSSHVKVIAYRDQRFHDPTNKLKATMYRLADAADAKKPKWQKKDHFEVEKKK